MTQAAPILQKVLLVDDDRVTNLMHLRLITRTGLVEQVDVATDGVAALDYLQTCVRAGNALPEIILLDINMPRMDGFEFLENYAVLPSCMRGTRTEVIMLSTSILRADHERAEADPNVHAFVSKPVNGADIEAFVYDYQDRLAG